MSKLTLSIFVLIVLLRLPSLWTPIIDVDESQFAGFANTLLHGGLPYIDSIDTKPLGIYWFFAAIFACCGHNNMIAVHAVTILWVGLTAWYLTRIGRALYSERAGVLAALFYAIFSTCYIPKFIATSITLVMMLPLTMSIWHLIRWEERGKSIDLWLAGLLVGLACLCKYQSGIVIVAVALYLLLFRPRRSLFAVLPFLAGVFVIGALFVATLIHQGVWESFVFASLKGSIAYIAAGRSTILFLTKLVLRGGSFVAATFLLWYFGVRESVALLRPLFRAQYSSERLRGTYLILLWFLLSFIPVSTGGRFFGHYFIQLLPPLCLLAAPQADQFLTWLTNAQPGRRRQWAYSLFLTGLLIPPLVALGARLVAKEIYEIIGEDYAERYQPIADYVRQHTTPRDTIFVWGFATPVYFFADRTPASRFLWCDWLTGRIAGSPTARDRAFDTAAYVTPGSWDMLFTDLDRHPPRYIIDTAPGNYHDYGKYPISRYPQLVSYLERDYQLEARVAGADFYRRRDEEKGATP